MQYPFCIYLFFDVSQVRQPLGYPLIHVKQLKLQANDNKIFIYANIKLFNYHNI